MTESPLKGSVWPSFQITAITTGNYLKMCQFFSDYENQKNYIPNIIEVKNLTTPKKDVTDTYYLMKTPWPLSNSSYINRHTFKHNKLEKSCSITWKQIKGDSAKKVEGIAIFSAKSNGIKLYYENNVWPNSRFASLVTGQARKSIRESVKSIVDAFKKYELETKKAVLPVRPF